MKVVTILAVVIAFDPTGTFEEHLVQQIPTAVVLAFVMFAALRRPLGFLDTKTGMIFAALFLLAMPGVIINKLFGGETGLFTAIALLSLPVSASLIDKNLDIDGFSLLRACQAIGVAFLIGTAICLYVIPREVNSYMPHERAFLLSFAIGPSLLLNRIAAMVLFMGSSVIMLLVDFHSTTAFCIINSILLPVLIVFMPRTPWISAAYMAIVAFVIISPFLGYDLVWELSHLVKGDVGGGIVNDEFRSLAKAMAINEWREAPVFGDFFTGAGAYDIRQYLWWWQYDLVALHDDYLDFLVRGGVIGLFLLVAAITALMTEALRTSRILHGSVRRDLFLANTLLMTSLVNVLFAMAFNPILNKVSSGFLAFLIMAWLIILSGVVRRRHRGSPATERRAAAILGQFRNRYERDTHETHSSDSTHSHQSRCA
jgi:hypothetical protein